MTNSIQTKVTIIGAGPSGLGCAALLKKMGIQEKDMIILDKNEVGSSFEAWPKQMKMITPSFPSNGYHQTDLNAITPDSSPAFSLGSEHPSGAQYASYLRNIAKLYELNVRENTVVTEIKPTPSNTFYVHTDNQTKIHTQFVIWAGGEYFFPNKNSFTGSELCIHNSDVYSWDEFEQDEYTVIGCYESGVDAAYHLAKRGKKVTILDEGNPDQGSTYDPSRVLSPFTASRLASLSDLGLVTLETGFKVDSISSTQDGYELISDSGNKHHSPTTPINCTGFITHLGPAQELFDTGEEGFPVLNMFDESTKYRNIFLSGPKLKHGDILLCFIYKFRGRFARPCSIIGAELELDTSVLQEYQQAGMLLDDLTCCEEQECIC
ncbi:NAD(P)/FAD-dependent oxidoreductase [Vibrio sonorensis]|uniref:NAD(P)/FAD-dependent oxidoreductase n=1 Tax=Vibrio sonorensis TaxID=1004316 RepID=UPI0008D99FC5|nr:NAD(P)/FAD-dependent oxidoreductase [Vibrio sonorensis]